MHPPNGFAACRQEVAIGSNRYARTGVVILRRGKRMTTIGISIDVEDVDGAVEFYRDGLGLRLIEKGDGWATMALGEQTFFLGLPWGPEGRVDRDHRDIGRRCI